MLTMAETTFLGLAITLSLICAGLVIFPASSYEISLVTSPNRETFHIPIGESFNITCKGSGDDAKKFSSLKWLNKEGQVIPVGIPGTQEEEKYSLTLTFFDPKEDESGVYKCLAVYENGQTLQKSVSIIFHGTPPLFDNTFETLTARENSPLEIKCVAKGEEPMKYEWYNQFEDKITEYSGSSIFVMNRQNRSDLMIPTVSMNHTGQYTCSARNNHGLSTKIFELKVLSLDGNDITTESALFRKAFILNVTTTTANFHFDVIGPVQYIETMYRDNRSEQETYFKFQYEEDYEFKNLIPAGLYSFKFRTSPSVNNQWSKPFQVVLKPEKPEVILVLQQVDSGTVKFEWLFKFEDRMKKTIDRHQLRYSMVQMVGGNSWQEGTCPITIEIPECYSSRYTIAGLSQNVYYEIQLRAHTAGGYSEPYSQKIFFAK